MTIQQQITAPPPYPSSANPATFAALADPYVQWQSDNLGPELNQAVTEINTEIGVLNNLGVYGSVMTFDAVNTADADPTPGKLRLNNLVQNTATVIRIDDVDVNGASIAAMVDSFDASAEAIKGTLWLVSKVTPTKKLAFNVTAVAVAAGYCNVTAACTVSSAASPFADGEQVYAIYIRNGASGTTAAAGYVQNQAWTAFATGGTGSAFTLAPAPALTAYVAGQSFWVDFHTRPLANATININGLGALSLKKRSQDNLTAVAFNYLSLESGDFLSGKARVTVLSGASALIEAPVATGKFSGYSASFGHSAAAIGFLINNIPPWVRRIDAPFYSISTNGTSNYICQIADAGGMETTGYTSQAATAVNAAASTGNSQTTGFGLTSGVVAAHTVSGVLTLLQFGINTWVAICTVGYGGATVAAGVSVGWKTLSAGPLTEFQITTALGVDVFDGGFLYAYFQG